MLIENTNYQLSRQASYMERSVMRDLLKHAVDPAIISLAGGLPASEHLPVTPFQTCLTHVLQRDGAAALQYSPPYSSLKQWIADYMRRCGVDCSVDNIFITNGNQQGLMILSRLFLDVGDTAVIEEAVFTGIQQGTAGMGAKIISVPTDLQSGVDVDALENVLRQHAVKMLVLIPDFHNPLGVSMSAAKRQRVAELAAQYRVPVVEDDAYSRLRFAGDMLPPVRAYDNSGYVFYMGSFSKMLSPALRLGWIVMPDDLLVKATVIRESIDLESSTLTQRAVAEFLQRGYLEPHLEQLTQAHKKRYQALTEALEKHLSDIASWTLPEGGIFSWLTLPQQLDTWELFDDALANGVVYIPGGAFSVNGKHQNAMRLNFSRVQPQQFDDALSRLSNVIRNKI